MWIRGHYRGRRAYVARLCRPWLALKYFSRGYAAVRIEWRTTTRR